MPAARAPLATFQRILVPVDFSEPSELALQYGKSLAASSGAELYVLYVMEDPMPGWKPDDSVCPVPVIRKDLEQEARLGLSKALTAAERKTLHVETASIWGKPHVQIVRYAKDHDVDLIVLGSHGQGFIEHMLIGSVAERVVRGAHCPVLVVRTPKGTKKSIDATPQKGESPKRGGAGRTATGSTRHKPSKGQ